MSRLMTQFIIISGWISISFEKVLLVILLIGQIERVLYVILLFLSERWKKFTILLFNYFDFVDKIIIFNLF